MRTKELKMKNYDNDYAKIRKAKKQLDRELFAGQVIGVLITVFGVIALIGLIAIYVVK